MWELIGLCLIVVFVMAMAEGLLAVVLEKVFNAFIRKVDPGWKIQDIRFSLSTAFVLMLIVAVVMTLSVSYKDGGPSYVGWPLPSKTYIQFEMYSSEKGRYLGRPMLDWNYFYIVLNVFMILAVLAVVGYLLERRNRK